MLIKGNKTRKGNVRQMKAWLSVGLARWMFAEPKQLRDDRGDVPGWVLVTVMTAGLVTAIWVLADTQLKAVLERAMNSLGSK